ncbi:hypothetical protein IFM89_039628 [Coptis chinensis]|uniref:Uncharacterized protein n=1 Tax=Coptis chinensis TaxID=261450 RepID=A0A835GVD2_9MAGN|nr:hypothetical protein IFM89_039628 [Coptis chinensis]
MSRLELVHLHRISIPIAKGKESLSGPIALRRARRQQERKALLYLVFEYLDTDLKKFIDSHRKGSNPPLRPPHSSRASSTNCVQGWPTATVTACFTEISNPKIFLVDKDKGILKIADLGLGRAFTVPPQELHTRGGLLFPFPFPFPFQL